MTPRSRRSWHTWRPSTRCHEVTRKDRGSSGARRPAWRIVPACWVVAVIGTFVLCGAGSAAAQVSPSAGQVHSHTDGQAHDRPDMARGAASDEPVHYVTLNVEISDAGIKPSSVFIPAGQPVQLVLRNRGTAEHHYRVVGLVPDDLVWVSQGGSAGQPGAPDDEHNHHDRQFVQSRAASPAGIRPTGHEVHAYVSGAAGIDVVLFTATRTGTFVVVCDLHPEKTGKLVVFDAGRQPTALVAAPDNALSLAGRNPLSLALSRDLGSVDYPGTSGVLVEATYAPAEYVTQILGAPAAMNVLEPDRYVGILLTESVHKGTLPGMAAPPDLYVSGSHLPLIDWKVTSDSPHHRATFYRFAPDDAFGTVDQVMTLRLASGQEATWNLPSPYAWNWLALLGLAGGLGFIGWLVWTTRLPTGPDVPVSESEHELVEKRTSVLDGLHG